MALGRYLLNKDKDINQKEILILTLISPNKTSSKYISQKGEKYNEKQVNSLKYQSVSMSNSVISSRRKIRKDVFKHYLRN
jgi:hypothetical protein